MARMDLEVKESHNYVGKPRSLSRDKQERISRSLNFAGNQLENDGYGQFIHEFGAQAHGHPRRQRCIKTFQTQGGRGNRR